MVETLFFQYESQIIWTAIVVFLLLLLRFTLKQSAKRIAKRDELNFVRTRLIFKYINVLVFFIAVFSLLLIWGVEIRELALVFSSVFAVLGIGLFAIWSVLSNITSGIIMFFSFPYKIGDKIKICLSVFFPKIIPSIGYRCDHQSIKNIVKISSVELKTVFI